MWELAPMSLLFPAELDISRPRYDVAFELLAACTLAAGLLPSVSGGDIALQRCSEITARSVAGRCQPGTKSGQQRGGGEKAEYPNVWFQIDGGRKLHDRRHDRQCPVRAEYLAPLPFSGKNGHIRSWHPGLVGCARFVSSEASTFTVRVPVEYQT